MLVLNGATERQGLSTRTSVCVLCVDCLAIISQRIFAKQGQEELSFVKSKKIRKENLLNGIVLYYIFIIHLELPNFLRSVSRANVEEDPVFLAKIACLHIKNPC